MNLTLDAAIRDRRRVRASDRRRRRMARTPLLRALKRLAEEHRTADLLGIDPAELRGSRQEAAYSRREFLKRAGVAGAAVAVAGPAVLTRPANAATAPRIAIVGGGIAGLTAALTLADAGVTSTVYEASPDRIGGRMHSDRSGYWSNGQISEFCGELIDSDHVTVRHLAQRFRLPTADLVAAQPNGSTDTNWFLGGYYSTDAGGQGLPADPQHPPGPGAGDRLPDHVCRTQRRGRVLRRHDGVRLDRAVRPGRPRLTDGPAARRRLQRGVRRRDDAARRR